MLYNGTSQSKMDDLRGIPMTSESSQQTVVINGTVVPSAFKMFSQLPRWWVETTISGRDGLVAFWDSVKGLKNIEY
jgi:hypothetical protein